MTSVGVNKLPARNLPGDTMRAPLELHYGVQGVERRNVQVRYFLVEAFPQTVIPARSHRDFGAEEKIYRGAVLSTFVPFKPSEKPSRSCFQSDWGFQRTQCSSTSSSGPSDDVEVAR